MMSLAQRLIVASLALLWPVAAWTQQPGGNSAIQGVVRAETGEALAGAVVILYGPRNPEPPQTPMAPASSRTTTTNGNGEFSFENLDAGSYSLRASASGFDSRAYGQESWTGGAIWLALGEDQRIANAPIRLPRLAVISGRVFDERSGEPLRNVPVDLTEADRIDATGAAIPVRAVKQTTTDDRGEYRLHSIPPGRYVLRVGSVPRTTGAYLERQIIGVSQTFAVRYFPGVHTLAEARRVEVRPGGALTIDMPTYRSPLYSIRGVVEDGTGRPPARVGFQLNDVNLPGQAYDPRTGAFEIRNVTAGSYTLAARSTLVDPVTAPAARVLIQITERDVEGLTLSLRTPASVAGRVRLDGASGNPPRGVSLFVAPIDTPVRGDLIPRTSAGEDGTFIIHGLLDGAYRVIPTVPPGFHVKNIRYGSTDILSGPWQFGGTATDVVEVVLGEGVARITGSVIDARGEPAPGAQIVLVPQERWRTDLVDRSPAIADQYGRFALENIPPGNYTLFAWAATEEIEPLNPEYIRQFEEAGLVMKLAASSEIHVDISVIPGRTVP